MKLSDSARESRFYNEDFAPVPLEERTWNTWNYTSIWIGMAVCVPTYMLASSMIQEGMSWWQAVFTILLGNLIVLVPLLLNGFPGAKYGIPFPVLIRSSFGMQGSILAGLLRGLVGCGWFGIQSWIGGNAIYQLILVVAPQMGNSAYLGDFIGLNIAQLICFFIFWGINIWIIHKGIETVRIFESWSAPLLLIAGLGLMIWAISSAGSFSDILAQTASFHPEPGSTFGTIFWPSLTAIVGFWATLSLNIPDFTRYAISQKAHYTGQALGLPTTMTLFSFIGIFVTSATILIFGEAIWDPIILLSKFDSSVVIILSMVLLSIATLSTNIAANVVASANDIANIAPKRISFKMGGYITGVIGILIFPWKLLADPSGYIFLWLIAYSALLGAITGIMICDFFVIRKRSLDLESLYNINTTLPEWNHKAWIAFGFSILPVLPGFLIQVGLLNAELIGSFWNNLYSYAWFITFGIAFLLYWILSGKK